MIDAHREATLPPNVCDRSENPLPPPPFDWGYLFNAVRGFSFICLDFWFSFINACGHMWCISTVSFPWTGCGGRKRKRETLLQLQASFASTAISWDTWKATLSLIFFSVCWWFGDVSYLEKKVTKLTKSELVLLDSIQWSYFPGMPPSSKEPCGHPYESLGNQKFLWKDIAGVNIWRNPSKCHVINGNQNKAFWIADVVKHTRREILCDV